MANYILRKDGPYGDQDAEINYNFQVDPKKKERISKIKVRSGNLLDAIGFAKIDNRGAETHTKMFGGDGGTLNKIELQLGDDITKITGKARNSQISQLMIYTKHHPDGYGPYGSNAYGKYFTSNVKGNTETVVGFFGSADDEDVASIGLYVKQAPLQPEKFIPNVSGWIGERHQNRCLAKFKIHTNLRTEGYGPFGGVPYTSYFSEFRPRVPSGDLLDCMSKSNQSGVLMPSISSCGVIQDFRSYNECSNNSLISIRSSDPR